MKGDGGRWRKMRKMGRKMKEDDERKEGMKMKEDEGRWRKMEEDGEWTE
jgi:hypothetical protein